jgi:tyrosyl-tRNA synthetase
MKNKQNINKRLSLIKRNLNEIIGEEELIQLLNNDTPLNHYIGFEISGLVHLGTGLSSMLKIRDLQDAGVNCRIFLADWHTWINDKLNGDHTFIKQVATEYFQPALEVCAKIVGADPKKIQFIHGTDLYHNNDRFWQSVVEISKNLTLSRVLKSTSIMGRDERNSQPFAWLIYPPMQVSDIFTLGINLTHSGTDQRKIHVIAREVALKLQIQNLKDINGEIIKPIAIHHNLLLGLQSPKIWPLPEGEEKESMRTQMKMSKSIPNSAIFIHDSEEEIREKIKQAFCPAQEIEFNPIIDWATNLILPLKGKLVIKRPEKFGGNITFNSKEDLDKTFAKGELHPMDLKNSIADTLVEILRPAREKFADQKSKNLIKQIKNIDEFTT